MSDAVSGRLEPLARAVDTNTMRERARERGYRVDEGGVFVEAGTIGLSADDRALFNVEGVRVEAFSVRYQRVGLVVGSPSALRELACLPVVRSIEPVQGYTTGE